MTLFYTAFTDVIERRDFIVIFQLFQEATAILQIFNRDFLTALTIS